MPNFSSASILQSFSTGLLSIHSFPQSILVLGAPPSQAWDLVLGHVEPHDVFLPVEVLPNGNPSLKQINCTIHLAVICKFAEGALSPTSYVIEDIKYTGPSMLPLGTSLVTGFHSDIELFGYSHPDKSLSI